MKKACLIVSGVIVLALLMVSAFAYPTGYTLETSGTGFASLSAFSHTYPASVKMGTIVGADKAAIAFNGDGTLNTITKLSYWTFTEQAGTFSQLTAWVAIYLDDRPGRTLTDWFTDYGASSPHIEYIQSEPYYTYADHTGSPDIIPTMNKWVKWDAFDAVMPLEWESLISPSPHNAPTLAQYIAGTGGAHQTRPYGPLYIVAIKIRMGYGGPWINTRAYVDDVTINDYFETFGSAVGGEWAPINGLQLLSPYIAIVALLAAGFAAGSWRIKKRK